MLPFEFVVEGTPVSLQTNNNLAKTLWKDKVLTNARASWIADDLPTENNVQVTIWHFYKKFTNSDIDNILKPIIDALKGLVYLDDRQVTDVIGRKREVSALFFLGNSSPLLRRRLTQDLEFIHVRIELAPDSRSL